MMGVGHLKRDQGIFLPVQSNLFDLGKENPEVTFSFLLYVIH